MVAAHSWDIVSRTVLNRDTVNSQLLERGNEPNTSIFLSRRIFSQKSDLTFRNQLSPIRIGIRIRIKIYKLEAEVDPDPHQFADVKPKCMEYEPILALLQTFELFLGG
jgi:hypothetical protein